MVQGGAITRSRCQRWCWSWSCFTILPTRISSTTMSMASNMSMPGCLAKRPAMHALLLWWAAAASDGYSALQLKRWGHRHLFPRQQQAGGMSQPPHFSASGLQKSGQTGQDNNGLVLRFQAVHCHQSQVWNHANIVDSEVFATYWSQWLKSYFWGDCIARNHGL